MAEFEILSPCGSADCVFAAARCGADAVYLGASRFSARKNAGNFGEEELRAAVRYLHSRGISVHVTINTLISDSEMPDALETLRSVVLAGADAVIIQDLGFAEYVRRCAPDIERHASTQMSVMTPAGFSLLEALGFKTAVLPRELTKKEIKEIRERSNLRLEAFVHGALCMCVSGQCLFSAMLGGRSGNRGLCAQPCRLEFSAPGGTGHDLSLKDLSLIERVGELADCGVSLLKIEGRMKRPEYVAAATSALRASLDGKPNPDIKKHLSAVFSRSGFTSGYFDGRLGKDMFGIRTKEDVIGADNETLSSLRRLYEKETPCRTVDFRFSACEGERLALSAYCDGKTVSVKSEHPPEKAKKTPTDASFIKEKLSKCGGTIFTAGDIEVELDGGLSIPAKEINALRRSSLSELESILSYRGEKRFFPPKYSKINPRKPSESKIIVRLDDPSQLCDEALAADAVIFPLGEEEAFIQAAGGVELIAEIPRGLFGREEDVRRLLKKAKATGIRSAYCPTLDAVALAKEAGLEMIGGFSLNAFNSQSVKELEKLGVKALFLSPELTLRQSGEIESNIPTGVFAYGRLPLMLTRNCPVKNGISCAECGRSSCLTDRKNIKFPVQCRFGCSEILNSVPIYLGDRKEDINADLLLLWFTTESKNETANAIKTFSSSLPFGGEYTRGLAYRGVQ